MPGASTPFDLERDLAAVVLAAGTSSRLGDGRIKQLVEIEDEPLVRRTCRAVQDASIRNVIVVVGYRAEEVTRGLQGLNLQIVHNHDHLLGQSTSVRLGLGHCSEARGVLFVPCDQPFLDASLIEQIANKWCDLGPDRERRIVLPCFQGRRGAPALFGSMFHRQLKELRGDTGGRTLIAQHPEAVVEVKIASERPLFDVDTDDDLRRLLHEST